MKELIISDLHLAHSNICMYCERPWLQVGDVIKTVGERDKWVSPEIKKLRGKEMSEDLVRNWNEVVDPEDTVKHLGDFCFSRGNSDEDAAYWESRLNGKIVHIKGNHDRHKQIKGMIKWGTMKAAGHEFLLIHRPPSRIDEIPEFCDVVLCGHVHEAWDHKWVDDILVVNMSCDVRNFRPMPLDQVIGEVEKLQRRGK